MQALFDDGVLDHISTVNTGEGRRCIGPRTLRDPNSSLQQLLEDDINHEGAIDYENLYSSRTPRFRVTRVIGFLNVDVVGVDESGEASGWEEVLICIRRDGEAVYGHYLLTLKVACNGLGGFNKLLEFASKEIDECVLQAARKKKQAVKKAKDDALHYGSRWGTYA